MNINLRTALTHPFVSYAVTALSIALFAKIAHLAYQSFFKSDPPSQNQPPSQRSTGVNAPPLPIPLTKAKMIQEKVHAKAREYLLSQSFYGSLPTTTASGTEHLDAINELRTSTDPLFEPSDVLCLLSADETEPFDFKLDFSKLKLKVLSINDKEALKLIYNVAIGGCIDAITNELKSLGKEMNFSFRVSEIDLTGTKASTRFLFNDRRKGLIEFLSDQLRVLRLSRTQSSLQGFKELHRLKNLEVIEFNDGAPIVQIGAYQAEQLCQFTPCPSVKKVDLSRNFIKNGARLAFPSARDLSKPHRG